MSDTRSIRIGALTRVEGEGGLYVRFEDSRIAELRLEIYEPPRFFEALLRGRVIEEVPDITARICGICPVAYQMSSVHALEHALGIQVNGLVRKLRRLLYCGEWIASHTLHIFLLHMPDFFQCDSALEVAERFPDWIRLGLRLKKHGNQLLETLGGRAIHPVNVAIGGFYRLPRADELQRLIPDFEWCLDAAVQTARWVASFSFPEFERDYQFVSLVHPDEYPFNEGDIGISTGERFRVSDYEQQFEEKQVSHSTALHCVRHGTGGTYLVGPLARIALNFDRLSLTARRLADELPARLPSANPFHGIVARSLEVVHAVEEALQLMRDYRPTGEPRVSYQPLAATGCAATEAPRGLLYHRYTIGEQGHVHEAKIIPPTSQNQAQIEKDLRDWLPKVIEQPQPVVARSCENLIRCYDPCISCATHFLKLHIQHR